MLGGDRRIYKVAENAKSATDSKLRREHGPFQRQLVDVVRVFAVIMHTESRRHLFGRKRQADGECADS